MVDAGDSKVIGFWDMLEKRTILLTATISRDLEDTLFDLFGVDMSSYLTFDGVLIDGEKKLCQQHIEYEIQREEKGYLKAMESAIS